LLLAMLFNVICGHKEVTTTIHVLVQRGDTALMAASNKGNIGMVRLLLEYGAVRNTRNVVSGCIVLVNIKTDGGQVYHITI